MLKILVGLLASKSNKIYFKIIQNSFGFLLAYSYLCSVNPKNARRQWQQQQRDGAQHTP